MIDRGCGMRSRVGSISVGIAVWGCLVTAACAGATSSDGGPKPSSTLVLSDEEEAALVAKAEELAFFDGEDSPTSVEVVLTTPGALKAAPFFGDPGPRFPAADDAEVFLVVMEGRFVGRLAKVPEGEDVPKGTTLWFVMDRTSLQLVAWGIGEEAIDPAAFGSPQPLDVPTPIVLEGTPPSA
jgi:hypothetical protein